MWASLRLAERSIPTAHILSIGFGSEERLERPDTVAEMSAAASALFGRIVLTGVSATEARRVLLSIEPFNRAPEIIDALEVEHL